MEAEKGKGKRMCSGKLRRLDEDTGQMCMLLVKGWPSWVLAAKVRGWHRKLVIMMDREWTVIVRKWFPGVAIVNYDEFEKWDAAGSKSVRWCFSDIDPCMVPHDNVNSYSASW